MVRKFGKSPRHHNISLLHSQSISYLGAYWLAFESEHQNHRFKVGTTFEEVVNLYVFDCELRPLVLDAVERIEVSVRSRWAYTLAHQYRSSHPHLESNLFKQEWNYQQNKEKLREEVNRNKKNEVFIKHFSDTYAEELPPIWAVCEIMTLSMLSQWFGNLRHGQDRNRIAHVYGMDEKILTSFLRHLSLIRNVCAHHSRLWNRRFTVTFQLPKGRPVGLHACFNLKANRKSSPMNLPNRFQLSSSSRFARLPFISRGY